MSYFLISLVLTLFTSSTKAVCINANNYPELCTSNCEGTCAFQDFQTVVSNLSIGLDLLGNDQSAVVTNVTVRVDLLHTYSADIEMEIIWDSVIVDLINDKGGGNDDMFIYFTDGGEVYTNQDLNSGVFLRPETPLSALEGQLIYNQYIRLSIYDDAGADQGNLEEWCIYELCFSASETMSPTLMPSVSTSATDRPTQVPSQMPTETECDYTTVDWDTEFTLTDSMIRSNISSSQYIGEGLFEIIVTASADYVVNATYGDETVGVTYVLDTAEFVNGERDLASPNWCENRYAIDFENLTFTQYWTYVVNPQNGNFPGEYGSGMEYPISEWDLIANGCESVTWTRSFTFNDLYYGCGFELDETDSEIILSGTFFLTLVSPSALFYPSNSDSGQYYVKQLQAHQVSVSFTKSYTLKTTAESVDLYGIQIVGAHYDAEEFLFTLVLYTYVPNYLQIGLISAFISTSGYNYTGGNITESDYEPSECLARDDYRCWQKFEITTTNADCNTDGFNDIFQILSYLQCYDNNDNNNPDSLCYIFMENYGENIGYVNIGTVPFNYQISCDEVVYNQDFSNTGLLGFATDSTFEEQDDDPIFTYGDIAYMKFILEDNLNSYSLIDAEIISGTLCTSDNSDITSCTDTNVNIFDMYDLLSDSTINYIPLNIDNNDHFSQEFQITIPVISQDYICVEILIELSIIYNDIVRRVLVSTSNQFNSFESFSANAKIISPDAVQVKDNNNSNKNNNNYLYIIAIVAALIIVIIGVAAAVCVRRYKNKQKKYQQVVEMQKQNVTATTKIVKDEFTGLVE